MDKTAELTDDNEVVFEWYDSKRRIAVVTVHPFAITWSGLINGERFSGRHYLPEEATAMLQKLFAGDPAP